MEDVDPIESMPEPATEAGAAGRAVETARAGSARPPAPSEAEAARAGPERLPERDEAGEPPEPDDAEEAGSRIPETAFDDYVAMGAGRSHRILSRRYGVSKRAITRRAVKEHWAERLENIETEARAKADAKLAETMEEMRERHQKMLRVMAARGLEGLKRFPLNSAAEAARVCEMAIKLERILAGEPSDRTAVRVEDVIKREYERWMTTAGEGDGEERDGDYAQD